MKGIFHAIWHHAQQEKTEEKKEEGVETFVVIVFVFSVNHYVCWGLACLEVAEHLSANGM